MKLGSYLALVASCSLSEASSVNLNALMAENGAKSSSSTAVVTQDDDGYDRSTENHEDLAQSVDSSVAKFHDSVKKVEKVANDTADADEAHSTIAKFHNTVKTAGKVIDDTVEKDEKESKSNEKKDAEQSKKESEKKAKAKKESDDKKAKSIKDSDNQVDDEVKSINDSKKQVDKEIAKAKDQDAVEEAQHKKEVSEAEEANKKAYDEALKAAEKVDEVNKQEYEKKVKEAQAARAAEEAEKAKVKAEKDKIQEKADKKAKVELDKKQKEAKIEHDKNVKNQKIADEKVAKENKEAVAKINEKKRKYDQKAAKMARETAAKETKKDNEKAEAKAKAKKEHDDKVKKEQAVTEAKAKKEHDAKVEENKKKATEKANEENEKKKAAKKGAKKDKNPNVKHAKVQNKKAEESKTKESKLPDPADLPKDTPPVKMLHAIFDSSQGKHGTDGLSTKISSKDALEGIKMYAEKKNFVINNLEIEDFTRITGELKVTGLDFNQFQMWATNFQKKAERESEHAVTFKKLDTDKSGKLSSSEAKAGIKSWAKANKVKITKDDYESLQVIFENNAGPKGELNLEQYVSYNEEVKEKMHRIFWKERLHSMWKSADGDSDGHIIWADAKMELEAWAGDNGVEINSDNLVKGDLINQQWTKEHGPELTEKEFDAIAPKVLGVDPLPDGKIEGWQAAPLAKGAFPSTK